MFLGLDKVGTISREQFPDRELTIFTIEGSADRDDMLDAVAQLPLAERTRNIVWDATNGTVGGMHYEDIKTIAESLRSGHGMRPGGRTALVAGSALDYGMARMFTTFASLKGLTVQYKCFRSLGDAMDWITRD